MNRHVLSVAALSLVLASCGGAAETEGEAASPAETAAASDAAAAAVPPPAAPGGAPDKAFMAGSWGDNGDCALAIEFKADGSMVGPFEKWELDDQGVLTMVGNDQKMHLKVIDEKTMESRIGGTGEPHKLTRC